MSGALAQEIPFESQRVPLERRITLKFQHREGFVNEYAANISLKGLFITAWVPEPPGSVFLFEVQIADQQRLIHGVGEVVWVRETEESPDRPSGMGVRFLKLDDDSREVIRAMVEMNVERGGIPFDPSRAPAGTVTVEDLFERRRSELDEAPAAVDSTPPATDTVELHPVAAPVSAPVATQPAPLAGRAMARRGRSAQVWLWLVLALLLGGSALAVLLT